MYQIRWNFLPIDRETEITVQSLVKTNTPKIDWEFCYSPMFEADRDTTGTLFTV